MSNPHDSITPDMAEKILAKDYANIVKKVTEGKPLTKVERDLIRRRTPRPSHAQAA